MTIQLNRRYLPKDHPFVVGVSGGPDSLCLLDLLCESGCPLKLIFVAHFDHQLRPASASEAGFVRLMAGKKGLAFESASADVRLFAKANGLSIEDAARTLRYRFLFDVARSHQAQAVLVAHTADDQVETVLMHFLRGAGLQGLRGMLPATTLPEFDPQIQLVRPLLHVWRSEIEAYCREQNLHPVLDASNDDQTYLRNRLRHSLIPELETYNPRLKETILRMAESLSGDYEARNELVESVWPKVLLSTGEGYLAFNLPALVKASEGLRRNLFRRGLEILRPDASQVTFDVLQRAARFASRFSEDPPASASGQVDVTEAIYLFVEGSILYMAERGVELPVPHLPQLEPGWQSGLGDLTMTGNWNLTVENLSGEVALLQARKNTDPFQAWLDADSPSGDFIVRPPRAGDRFQPLGMESGSIKLSDFFINIKLPKRLRRYWPLVCKGDEIVWVAGQRISHLARLTASTIHAVHLVIKKE